MSELRRVLDRIQTDYEFYLSVLTNPAEALVSYSLTETERSALTASDKTALWYLVLRETVVNGGGPPPPPPPPGPPPPPPPGPPPPPPPPPGPPPPPPPGPPPPPPPPPGPPPPPPPPPGFTFGVGPVPPPPPPGTGVFGVGHHDFFNQFSEWEESTIDEILSDPNVIEAVQAVNQARAPEDRIDAIERLMETLE
jgi:hypothetical protein